MAVVGGSRPVAAGRGFEGERLVGVSVDLSIRETSFMPRVTPRIQRVQGYSDDAPRPSSQGTETAGRGKSSPGTTFHLIAEGRNCNSHTDQQTANVVGSGAAGSPIPSVEVPRGLSFLPSRLGGDPQPLDEDDPVPEEEGYLVEPLAGEGNPRLLLVRSPGLGPVRVNGRRAAAVTLLKPGDQVRFQGGGVMHVTLFHRPFVGRAPRDVVGRRCGYCRTTIGADDAVHLCWSCKTPIHHGSGEESGDERLECASLAPSCTVCGRPLALVEGYSSLPELQT